MYASENRGVRPHRRRRRESTNSPGTTAPRVAGRGPPYRRERDRPL